MKPTTVSLATKSVEIAQMLTSLLGKKRLLLTLAATLVCLQTATAMKAPKTPMILDPRGNDGERRVYRKELISSDPDRSTPATPAPKPEKPDITWALSEKDMEKILSKRGYEVIDVQVPLVKSNDTQDENSQAEPTKGQYKTVPGWRKGGSETYTFDKACEKENVFVKGVSKYANKHFLKLASTLGLGAVGLTIGFGFTADALAEIEKNHALEFDVDPVTDELVATGERGHKEILTKFGEGKGGNCIAALICLLVAGGAALLIFLIANYWVKGNDQHNMKAFQFWMTFLTFSGTSFLMLGLNFMEQDAASSTAAFGNALSFHGENGGTSGAEIGAGVLIYSFFIMFIVVAVLGVLFYKKAGCFKRN